MFRNPPSRRSTAGFASCSCCRPRHTASATAATMRRRRWASSRVRCSPADSVGVQDSVLGRACDRCAWHAGRRLADHSHDGIRILRGCSRWAGFAAETAGAISLFARRVSVCGEHDAHHHRRDQSASDSVRRLSAVDGIAGQTVWAWILTIPMSAAIATGIFYILHFSGGGAAGIPLHRTSRSSPRPAIERPHRHRRRRDHRSRAHLPLPVATPRRSRRGSCRSPPSAFSRSCCTTGTATSTSEADERRHSDVDVAVPVIRQDCENADGRD